MPAGQSVSGSIANLQVIAKNQWPDGSLKYAVVSGRAALTAGQAVTVTLANGSAAAGTVLSLTDLKSSGVVASVGCGGYGTAQWVGADWDAPFYSWISGPQMSSWIYRKPVGTDAHLVAWLEVRIYAGGAVEVLPWIENGYLKVAGPTNKSATYTFALGGAQRFSAAIDLPHHCRTPLISGTMLSHWLGTDPQVTPKHDASYMQATGLVPTYMATVSPAAAIVAGLVASYAPLQTGNFLYDGGSMTATGYQEPIGLLPQHDVLYLTTSAPAAYDAVVRNGFSAGRYPIHYRDESTNRPLRFSSYPTLVISDGSSFQDNGGSTTNSMTPTVSGTLPPKWDTAHSPSVGFMAYLVTGRWYFMEEAQFAATCNYLGKTDTAEMRNGAKGLVQSCGGGWQTRCAAWMLRSLAQALAITPDSDANLRTELINSMHSNIDQFHAQYVAQPSNPWGWVEPGEVYGNNLYETGAVWQQDFVTAATGYSLAMNLPIDSSRAAKWSAFFAWKAQSVVKRLGTASGFWYINADVYAQRIASGPMSKDAYRTGSGPWLSEAASYAAQAATLTSVSAPSSWLGTTDGTLCGEIMPGDRALWGNLQPAIAYAVQHGVSGAQAAYARLTSARNWNALSGAFDIAPVWSVKPGLQ